MSNSSLFSGEYLEAVLDAARSLGTSERSVFFAILAGANQECYLKEGISTESFWVNLSTTCL